MTETMAERWKPTATTRYTERLGARWEWRLTGGLRWNNGILEQEWLCMTTSDPTEWHPVPDASSL
jgi:hypothetical protein